ncbi:DUF1328 domain-containing protein [Tateyamaria sp. SN6-1]|uniref:DUF1328 domain-containing protein n=1 Tax=Tateyamaria sp. SN6-1 TaxID=3092148 RepID=UPI0039F59EF9
MDVSEPFDAVFAVVFCVLAILCPFTLTLLTQRFAPHFCSSANSGTFCVPATLTSRTETKGNAMLYWSIMFLIIALVAAVFGFGGIAAASTGVAQILFVLFIILFAITVVVRLLRGRS